MQLTSKTNRQFRAVCAAVLVAACCFRSADLLTQGQALSAAPSFALLPFRLERVKPSLQQLPDYDSSLVDIDNRAGVEFDIAELLSAPVEIKITEQPCVLIVHTHATEAYADAPGYRSEDLTQNVVRVGQELAQTLQECGIPTVHDTALHDLDNYDDAYVDTEQAIAAYLQEYPSIRMVIDLHRDAVQDSSGQQKALRTELNGETAAQLLLVIGSHTAELPHPNWQSNLSFAAKLQAYIREQTPELLRRTSLRAARYNEHLTPYSLLLEVGTAGNTQQEALCSVRYFGKQLAELLLAYGQPAD